MPWPKQRPSPDARAVLCPHTAEERAELYSAALREMEQQRDDLIAACLTLRRMVDNERKIAARERGVTAAADPGAPEGQP